METIKNSTQLFIGLADTNTAGIEGDVISDYADLTDGEIAICDHKNVVLTASNNLVAADFPSQEFKFIARSGTQLIHSPLIGKGDLVSYGLAVQAAEVQQVDYVGSNGTTGSLGAIVSNLHTIRLYIREWTIQGFMQQKIKEGFYKSAASTTQYAIALGLVNSLVANYSREPEQDLLFERVNDGSRTAVPTSADNFTFTKGSKYFTATDIDDATGTAALVVGDLIVIGTAVTSPVYKITAIDAATNIGTLDRAFVGATTTLADTALKVIVVAQEGNYGIKITGVDRGFQTGFRNPEPISWKTTIDFGDSSSTTVNETTAAYPGVGTPQQLAKLELELQADENVYRSFAEAGVTPRSQMAAALAAGTKSDVIRIDYTKEIETGLGVVVKSPATILLASVKESANTLFEDADSGLVVALDKIIVTNWAHPGASVLQASMT